ncbi:MAG: glycoside hydrolase family 66 protein [bacterium]|nr:glycoside hydrolase family 66 protein [bacterium]
MSDIRNYCVYYGKGRIRDLCKFDLVIIQPAHYTPQEIAFLKTNKTKVLGYLSIGEDYPLKVHNGKGPGGYASWYLDYFTGVGCDIPGPDGKPDRHKDWGSYFVNPKDKGWQQYVIYEKMATIVEDLGCSGAFLDTVLYPHLYPEDIKEKILKPGMIELIRKIRETYPQEYLLVNNGWIVLQEITPFINAIMYESFSSTLKKLKPSELSYTTSQANRINSIRGWTDNPLFDVFTLDYTEETDLDLITFAYRRARSFGFIPSVSSLTHSKLYMVNLEFGE